MDHPMNVSKRLEDEELGVKGSRFTAMGRLVPLEPGPRPRCPGVARRASQRCESEAW